MACRGTSSKTIFLVVEQGLGDAIQFVRYAPLVAVLGAKVVLGVHRPLAALMRSVPGVSQVVGDGDALPDFDLYCLPRAFGTELATIPAQIPYIHPQEDLVAKWRERLPQAGRLRVGICWAGNRDHMNDSDRSIALQRFADVLVPGIDFISLFASKFSAAAFALPLILSAAVACAASALPIEESEAPRSTELMLVITSPRCRPGSRRPL